jgi:hypothetical protein
MIKLVQCVKASRDASLSEFRQSWRRYQEQVRALAERFGIERVDFSVTLAVDSNLQLMLSRGTRQPYDAMAEAYFPSAGTLRDLAADAGFRAAVEELRDSQETYFDLESSTFFFAVDEDG